METKEEERHRRVTEKYKSLNAISDYEALLEEDCEFQVAHSVKDAIDLLHPDVANRAIGMALNQTECWEGLNIVDLGCGCGRDAFFMSKLVGPKGRVFGVDFSEERIHYAKEHIGYHTEKFGFDTPNIDFQVSLVENIKDCGVKDQSVDLVTTNGVIVLCPNHAKVYQAANDILKYGGEMFFSEIYSDQTTPEKFDTDMRLLSHGLDGEQWETFLDTAQDTGFCHPRLYRVSKIVFKESMKKDVEPFNFVIATYRMFKLPPGDKTGNFKITYKGGVKDHEEQWIFDHSTCFKKNQSMIIDGELASILKHSRFAPYFDFEESSENSQTAHPKYSPFKLQDDRIHRFKPAPRPT